MKRFLLSLTLLISAPVLMAGKPSHQNNRLAIIIAAKTGDIKTVRFLVEKGLITHRTMNCALETAVKNNPTKTTDTHCNNHTLIIEFLFDRGAH